jgi:hypothetical protein
VADSQLTPATRKAIQRHFRRAYIPLVTFFASVAIAATAWHWSLPKGTATGFSWQQAGLILLGAAILINGLSFFIHDRFVQRLLKRPHIKTQFSVWNFALRFYGYNLAIAVLFSLIGFYPLIVVVFFFVVYPIMFWLLPYHLIMGFLLGQLIQRKLARS